jgi:hypothetical protein
MATHRTVTKQARHKSSRTAADSQPIPRLSLPSAQEARRLGLGDAAKVVQWLNASRGTASHERVLLIRRELEALPSEFVNHASAYVHVSRGAIQLGEAGGGWPKEKLKMQMRIRKRHVALNKALKKYVFRPRATYLIADQAWVFGFVPDENKRWFEMQIGDETISEGDAVMSLVRLAEIGDLGRVRLCEMCKERWRVAAKRNYRFCSDQCREAFYAKAPEYHSRKAASQRKYREKLKRMQAAQGTLLPRSIRP